MTSAPVDGAGLAMLSLGRLSANMPRPDGYVKGTVTLCYQLQEKSGSAELKATVRGDGEFCDMNIFFQGPLAKKLDGFLQKKDQLLLHRMKVCPARDEDSDYTVDLHCSEGLGTVVSVLRPTLENGRVTIEPGKDWTPPKPGARQGTSAGTTTTRQQQQQQQRQGTSGATAAAPTAVTGSTTDVTRGQAQAGSASTASEAQQQRAKQKPAYTYVTTDGAARVAHQRQLVNVYGVVTYFRQPQPTRKDYLMAVTISDASWNHDNDGLKMNLFATQKEQLPPIKRVGDIIRVHGLKLQVYNGSPQGVANFNPRKRESYVLFHGQPGMPLAPYAQSSKAFSFTDTDKSMVTRLRSWVQAQASMQPHQLLSETTSEGLYDVLVQVLSVLPSTPRTPATLIVWDGSQPPPNGRPSHSLFLPGIKDVVVSRCIEIALDPEAERQVGKIQPYDVMKITRMAVRQQYGKLTYAVQVLTGRATKMDQSDADVQLLLRKLSQVSGEPSSGPRSTDADATADATGGSLPSTDAARRSDAAALASSGSTATAAAGGTTRANAGVAAHLVSCYDPPAKKPKAGGTLSAVVSPSMLPSVTLKQLKRADMPLMGRCTCTVVAVKPSDPAQLTRPVCSQCNRSCEEGAGCRSCGSKENVRRQWLFSLTLHDGIIMARALLYGPHATTFLGDVDAETFYHDLDLQHDVELLLHQLSTEKPSLELGLQAYTSASGEHQLAVFATQLSFQR